MAAAFLAAPIASADITEEQVFTYDLDDGGRVSIENVNGNVTVTGGSGDEVEIVAVKKGKNQEYLDEIKIIVEGGTLSREDPADEVETPRAKRKRASIPGTGRPKSPGSESPGSEPA